MGLARYVKRAFLNQWNLLAFLGATGFALLSGQPDVVLPLVLAGEAAYLGFFATHPKFQRYSDAMDAKEQRQAQSSQEYSSLLNALPRERVQRFEALRDRCLALREIATQLRATQGVGTVNALEEVQLADLDRLLWIYLRMHYTQHMLDRFFERTDEQRIQRDIKRLEQQIQQASHLTDSPTTDRILPAMEENLKTLKTRLANLEKAKSNYYLLQAELEGLENKIQSISELAINRHDPEYIAGQVDQIAQGLVRTEETMNELQADTGMDLFQTKAPPILSGRAEDREAATGIESSSVEEERGRRRQSHDDGIKFL